MTNFETPPAPEQAPLQKDNQSLKYSTIAFLAAAFAVLVALLIVTSNNDRSGGAATVTPITTEAPPATTPIVNKYDQYMDHVRSNSGQSYSWPASKVIEFGDVVCTTLRNGSAVSSVVSLFDRYAKTDSDTAFFAAVMTGTVMYICPEYTADLQAYIRN
jgi:hypothetical protein